MNVFTTDFSTMLAAIVVLLSVLWWLATRRSPGIPPGPGPALPLIGHMHLLSKDSRFRFRKWRQQYGDIFSLYIANRLLVVLNGYEIIKDALVKRADAFSDRPKNTFFTLLLSNATGIADASGSAYKIQRKTTVNILKRFGMGKNILAQKVQEEVGEFIKALRAKNSQASDLRRWLQVSVSNNMCSISFGKRFDYDDQKLQEMMNAVEKLLQLIGAGSSSTIMPFLRYIPGDPFNTGKAFDRYYSIVDTFLMPIINQHIQDYDEEDQNDFISAYLRETREAQARGTAEVINELNLPKVLMDLFIASQDIPATILWAIVYFLHYPEVQEKCYQDIVKITGRSRVPEIRDKAKMPYLEATILEVLRISELLGTGFPHATTYEVQFHGYTIPKDTVVLPNLDSVLHDPDIWEKPDKFRPERFLDAEGKVTQPEQLISFSMGRRVCPGESIARMELFLYLSNMIQSFCFLPPEDGQLPSVEGTFGIVLAPKPFQVRAVARV